MRSRALLSLVIALSPLALAQQATVQNAATFQSGGGAASVFFNGTIAFASFLLGPALSTPNVIAPRMLAVLTYPTTISAVISTTPPTAVPVNAQVWIRPSGSSAPITASVVNAVPGQVTFVVPAGIPVGGGELLYQINGQSTQWTTVQVVASSFELFRISSGGPAIAQVLNANGSTTDVGLAAPVQPGQTLLLTGSGLGYGASVSATIGGAKAPVTYAGPDATQAGHDRVLIQVPASVPDGCYVPLTFTINQTAITTTISKTADGSLCKHPWQLSAAELKTLDNGGFLANATLSASTQLSAATPATVSRAESASLDVGSVNAGTIASYFNPVPSLSACSAQSSSAGVTVAVRLGGFAGGPVITQPPPPLDIGRNIDLQNLTTDLKFSGSNNFFTALLPPSLDGTLDNLPGTAFTGGKSVLQILGGADLAASSFAFNMPSPILLNASAPIILRRNQDQTIAWNGSAFDANASVNLSIVGNGAPPVSCVAPAAAGSVVIPSALLNAFPAGTLATLTISARESGAGMPHGELPLKSGANLLMLVSLSSSDSRPAVLQ